MKYGRGFTLLELLMVVIIIAILATIALPGFINTAERSRMTEAVQMLSALRSAEHRAKAQSKTNDYAAAIATLDTAIPVMNNWGVPAIAVTPSAGAIPAKGQSTAARSAGQFAGKTVGIQFGTGTICGDFPPAGVVACVQD